MCRDGALWVMKMLSVMSRVRNRWAAAQWLGASASAAGRSFQAAACASDMHNLGTLSMGMKRWVLGLL